MDLLTVCNDTIGFKMHAKELCASNILGFIQMQGRQ